MIVDLVTRWRALDPLYTDAGVLPRPPPSVFPSVLTVLPGEGPLRLLVLIGFLGAVLLAAGRRGGAALALYVVGCLHARNPYVTYGALRLEAGLLLCAALPGRPSALLGVQLTLLYADAAVTKLTSPAWRLGDAVRAALALDPSPGPLTPWLSAHPGLLTAATWATLGLELAAAPLLWSRTSRRPVLVGLAAFHVVSGVLLSVALFPVVALVGLWGWWTAPDTRPGREVWVLGALLVAADVGAHVPAAQLLTVPARVLGVPQGWAMYANVDGAALSWPVVVARRADGTEVDAWDGGAVDASRAGWAARETLAGDHLEELLAADARTLRADFAAWACQAHDAVEVEVYEARDDATPVSVGQYRCP